MWDILATLLLTLFAVGAWAANIVGLPGNWVAVVSAVVLAYGVAPDRCWSVAWGMAGTMLVVAIIGELLEFAAGAIGASRLGGSKRGAILALLGSIFGAIAGLFVGTPIPIIGQVLASLLLGGAGAFGGAVIGERWSGKDWDQSIDIGSAAFWGRLLGTVGKVVCGTIVCGLFLVSLWFCGL